MTFSSASRRLSLPATLAFVCLLLVSTDADVQPLRALATIAFVLYAPGAAVIQLVFPSWHRELALATLLAVALSGALAIVVAQALIALRWWYPEAAVMTLAILTLTLCASSLGMILRTGRVVPLHRGGRPS